MCEIKKSVDCQSGEVEIVVTLSAKDMMEKAKDPLTFFLLRSADLKSKYESLQRDVKSLSDENERLRAEIVRLAGGEKSSERITGASRLALKAMESKSICPGCAFFTAGFNGGFFCRHHSPSREIYFVDIVDTGRPRWCPL